MMNPGMYGEMFTLLPIYAAAVMLGLISGVVTVRCLVMRRCQVSLRAYIGIVALASLVSCLVAANPEFWSATLTFWGMGAVMMSAIDLAVVSLLSHPRERRRLVWATLWIIAAFTGVIAVLKLRFDIPLQMESMPSFAVGLFLTILVLFALDLAVNRACSQPAPPTQVERSKDPTDL